MASGSEETKPLDPDDTLETDAEALARVLLSDFDNEELFEDPPTEAA